MKTETKIRIGNIIKTLRDNHGLNQTQLGDILGTTRAAVAKWEGGESAPMAEMMIRISKVFDISCDYILTGKANEPLSVASDNNYNKSIYGDHYVSKLSAYEKQILLKLRILNRDDKGKVAEFINELTPKIEEE